MTSTYWAGGNSGDFYKTSNWSSNQSPLNFHDVDISGTSATNTATATASTASSGVIPSLTIGSYGTLDITAHACGSSVTSPVFSTSSFQIFQNGTLDVNTSSAVQLGQFNEIGGTLTIENNQSNVFLSSGNRLAGDGNLNLVNATFGSQANIISIDNAMHVSLSGNSSIYTGFLATGSTVSFDPKACAETFFLAGNDTTVDTQFSNVGSNTHFAIEANSGGVPVSAAYQQNANGSYSLNVQESNNQTLTLSNITPASGFTPGALTISQDKAGNYIINNAQQTSAGNGNGCGNGGGWGCGNGGGWGEGWGGNWGWGNGGGWGCGNGGGWGSNWGWGNGGGNSSGGNGNGAWGWGSGSGDCGGLLGHGGQGFAGILGQWGQALQNALGGVATGCAAANAGWNANCGSAASAPGWGGSPFGAPNTSCQSIAVSTQSGQSCFSLFGC